MSSEPCPSQLARQAFAAASVTLGKRWRGDAATGPDWLCRDAVQSLALPLQSGSVQLNVMLRDGVAASALPTAFHGVPLVALRRPPVRAQRRPPLMTLRRSGEDGTATAWVRDRLNGQRSYLLTCAHVVAPDRAARYGDEVRIALAAGEVVAGHLREWQPAVGPGVMPSSLDAALVEIGTEAVTALRALDPAWLPSEVTDALRVDMQVALQRVDGPLDGALCEHWSGEVGAGDDAYPDYFLQDAIGYRTTSSTQGGDSGGAIWSEGDRLLGMHIGAIEGDRQSAANAVMARVKPALDWYCVKPYTRFDPATLTATDWPTVPEASLDSPNVVPRTAELGDLLTLAKTLWGEARGEGVDGMAAVAAVIINRFRARYRGCRSIEAVCRDPRQFSCWNSDDPNMPRLHHIDVHPDDSFREALAIARRALSGSLDDSTAGSKHYVAVSLPAALRPDWLRGKRPCAVIGRHEFYNDIL